MITHATLGTLMAPIVAQQIIGAYQPCYSGAVIDDISAMGIVTVTSQDASHPNSWGWAGKWREALRGGTGEDPTDTDGDGYVSITEAYEWIAPKSQAEGEHSMMDDNGDGAGSEWGQLGFDPADPAKDGFAGARCSLDGYTAYLKHGYDTSYRAGDVENFGYHEIRMSEGDDPGTAWYWIDIGTTCVEEGMQIGIYFCDWSWFGNGPSVYIQNKETWEYELLHADCGSNDSLQWVWTTRSNSNMYVWDDGRVWLKVYAQGGDDTVVDKMGIIFEQCTGPSAPDLLTPSNGATCVEYDPTYFDWADVPGASEYEINISPGGTYSTSPSNYSTTLSQNTGYSWKVRASNGSIWGDWSATWTFTTGPCENYPPTGTNPQVSPSSGPWDTPFDYSIYVDDPESDSVDVVLETRDPSSGAWESQGTRTVSGSGTAAWDNRTPFESNDAGMTSQYRFNYDDGHNTGTWGPYWGPVLEGGEVYLGEAITCEWVNGWQDHGPMVTEFDLGEEVHVYLEWQPTSHDFYGDIIGFKWYHNGIMEWENTYEITEHWYGVYWHLWWAQSVGSGYIEAYWNDQYLGQTNDYFVTAPPTVVTNSASEIESTAAILNGTVLDDGGEACEVRFQIREQGGSWWYPSGWGGSYTAGQAFSELVSSLDANTTYEFQAGARNSAGDDWGAVLEFTTPPMIVAPTVQTDVASGIGRTSATLNGTVLDDGAEACEVRFQIREQGGSWWYPSDWSGSYTTGQAFSELVSSLDSNTTYEFQAAARNSAGEDWGQILSFTTAMPNLFDFDGFQLPFDVQPLVPSICRSPSTLTNSCVEGHDAPSQTFEVWNCGEGTLSYTITDDVGWLSCNPGDGTSTGEHDTITCTYTTAALESGEYSATITISDPAADNDPQTIQVYLTVGDGYTIEIDGQLNCGASSSGVPVWLTTGVYQLTVVNNPNDHFDAWSLWPSDSDPDCTPYCWRWEVSLTTPSIPLWQWNPTGQSYATQQEAIQANEGMSTTITIEEDALVYFWADDSGCGDNRGGMTLEIEYTDNTLWSENFDDGDISDWTVENPYSEGGYPITVEVSGEQYVSPAYGLKISGPSSEGYGATLTGPTVPVDLNQPFTLRFSFRWNDFHWYRMAFFGPVKLQAEYPWMPMAYWACGQKCWLADDSFQTYCPANTWTDFRVDVDPASLTYDVYANDQLVGTATYCISDVGNPEFWIQDHDGNTNYVNNGYYDDLSVSVP